MDSEALANKMTSQELNRTEEGLIMYGPEWSFKVIKWLHENNMVIMRGKNRKKKEIENEMD